MSEMPPVFVTFLAALSTIIIIIIIIVVVMFYCPFKLLFGTGYLTKCTVIKKAMLINNSKLSKCLATGIVRIT